MSKARKSGALWAFYGISLGLHTLLAVGAVVAPEKARPSESVAIALQEIAAAHDPVPPPLPPPPPPKPPPPKPPPPKEEAKAEPEPTPDAGGGAEAFEDLGMVMGNNSGPGVAVAMNRPRAEAKPEAVVRKKVASLGPKPGDGCSEEPVKPKPIKIVKPAYSESARQASIEGIVRVEAMIDESGKVIAVRVLKGIGYGLDEAAVAAVKEMEWQPAARCGKPMRFAFAFNLRFNLAS